MEKLPQRNLLLPNAPITPFSTTKKSKHPFKQLLSTSGKHHIQILKPSLNNLIKPCPKTLFYIFPSPKEVSSSSKPNSSSNNTTNISNQQQQPIINGKSSKSTDELTSNKVVNLAPLTPQTIHKNNPATPSTLTSHSVAQSINTGNQHNPAIISLQKQLKYDESPSSSLKLKLEKSSQLDSHDCRRRLEMLPSSKTSKHHHHHHRDHKNREYRASSSTNSSSKQHHRTTNINDPYYHHRNTNTAVQHHHYVNAIPSPNTRASSGNRYINQSDLCTKIISGNYMPMKPKVAAKELAGSFSSSNSSSISSNEMTQTQNQKYHNHTSACCGVENSKQSAAERSAIDNSMRCTLRRGRPNTPKTGLNVDYRIRKSSVPNTPECTHLAASRVNHTISSDDYKHISGEDLKKNLTSYIKAAASSSKTLKIYF